MVQKCLIRREMAKKCRRQMAAFGSSGDSAAFSFVFCVDTFNSKNLQNKLYRYHQNCA